MTSRVLLGGGFDMMGVSSCLLITPLYLLDAMMCLARVIEQ